MNFNLPKWILNKIKNFFNWDNMLFQHLDFSNNRNNLRFNGSSVFDYSFLMSLNEKEYPKYLSQAYYIKIGQKLRLRNPKTINEKIQWLKIYDNQPIKTKLTDKILVRDWIEKKIGKEYLKPALWIGKSFDLIPFEILPEKFIIKTNHGCNWNVIIRKKSELLSNKTLLNFTKNQIEGWLNQNYFGWSDFETQYKNIKPQIIIEELLNNDEIIQEFNIWCFNGKPQIFQSTYTDIKTNNTFVSVFNKNYENIDIKFLKRYIIKQMPPDLNLKKAVSLSTILAEHFKLVRIDWLIFKNKLYFEEMTFTPQSGYLLFYDEDQKWSLKLGNLLNLKGE